MQESLEALAQSRTFPMVNGKIDSTMGSLVTRGDTVPSLPGIVIDEKYRIVSLLGEGGMGIVYRAHHINLDREVALKTLLPGVMDREAWQRFQREVRAVAKLDSAHVVRVFDCGLTEDNMPYFTMELLHGESLADRLQRVRSLPIDEALKIFIDVAKGLTSAHNKGIVHRDLKPANIFLELHDGKVRLAKVVDFGIAKLVGDSVFESQKITATGTVFGSPLYMSPEQSMGLPVEGTSDVYSFGCALYETLTGRPPFIGLNAYETMAHHQQMPVPSLAHFAPKKTFPYWLELVMAGLLKKEKEKRLQSFPQILKIIAYYSNPKNPPLEENSQLMIPADDEDHGKAKRVAIVLMIAASFLIVGAVATFKYLLPKNDHVPIVRSTVLSNPRPTLSGAEESKKIEAPKAVATDAQLRDAIQGKALRLHNLSLTTANLATIASFSTIDLDIARCQFPDTDFAPLLKSKMQGLNVEYTNFSDGNAGQIADSQTLFKVLASDSFITDTGLKSLAKLPLLRMIEVRNTVVTDTGVSALYGKAGLRLVDVSKTVVTGGTLARLCDSTRTIETVRLAKCPNITPAQVADLRARFPRVGFDDKGKEGDPTMFDAGF